MYVGVEGEFILIEQIELLTVDIRRYASQILDRGWIENEPEAIAQLEKKHIFDIPAIARFYFSSDDDYLQLKADLQTLDDLRLLILDYLRSGRNAAMNSLLLPLHTIWRARGKVAGLAPVSQIIRTLNHLHIRPKN